MNKNNDISVNKVLIYVKNETLILKKICKNTINLLEKITYNFINSKLYL